MHETGELECFPCRHQVAVHDVERVTGLPHVQPRQRAPGAADGIEGAAFAAFEQAGVSKRRPHDLFRLLDRLRRNILQCEPAQRQRQTGLDALPMDFRQFE
jgi:hypothetical protein